ncbi:MAG: PfaD family polyunsaturated fatty acid/polyketide biosynthesis protein [Gemmataceae bacterium]|nr:PfaD family polyunsaturated fatty acid/polyketide biosynthesis protein [Gemmataceae bacterium]MDW8242581.1 PfaD family polyunsaturated fatty acid/polyketide biosynthesis protein [Thermogemmata sp.]
MAKTKGLVAMQDVSAKSASWWLAEGGGGCIWSAAGIRVALGDLSREVIIVRDETGRCGIARGGRVIGNTEQPQVDCLAVIGVLAPLEPWRLGHPAFRNTFGVRYAYMTGAMANGIASVELVQAASQAGFLGSFGAAGLSLERIEAAVERLQREERPFCVNLIHSPQEPAWEWGVAELLVRRGVRCVEASAFLELTPAIVWYAAKGNGQHRVIAKVSREEVARQFLSPPPDGILGELVSSGRLSEAEAQQAARRPVATAITVEADSGGHTDNRPALALFPVIAKLADQQQRQQRYPERVLVGLGGGIATPEAVAAAWAMGADYVVTGSVNQACVEAGTSEAVRTMLAQAGIADMTMAPAADMFEMGVKVQVLKRGTLFAMRAQRLYELYRNYDSWDNIPASERHWVEQTCFRQSFAAVWQEVEAYWQRRDPEQLVRAQREPKHRLALAFRWYLGMSSRWANRGERGRELDYQVWCGPGLGAFNCWVRGTALAAPAARTVAAVGWNLLYGSCIMLRRLQLRLWGIPWSDECFPRGPWPVEQLQRWFDTPERVYKCEEPALQ